MENIVHKNLRVNGINMHVAELGDGPESVLFLHGFPELWYSWRHEMVHLSAKGYRTIAPDLRGYGDTEAPPSVSSYTVHHVVGDLVALLDALGVERVFLVGHDWGAIIAWFFCLMRPDRVKALVNSSVVFQPRDPSIKPVDAYRAALGDGFYMCRFQKPGEAEEAFSCADTASVMRAILTNKDPNPPSFPDGLDLRKMIEDSPPESLPPWLTQQDIDYYAAKFKETGFTGGLNYYRAMDLSWELTAPWTGSRVTVPVKFIIGDQDMVYNFPGVKEFLHGGGLKHFVPDLQEVVVMEGVGHFINQESAEEFSQHVYDFIKKF